jgi:hypothetical protein
MVVSRKDRFDSLWKALAPHFAHRLGTAINRQDAIDYRKTRLKQGKSNSTIKTELEFLRACLRFHYGAKAPRFPVGPESAPRERYLTVRSSVLLRESTRPSPGRFDSPTRLRQPCLHKSYASQDWHGSGQCPRYDRSMQASAG